MRNILVLSLRAAWFGGVLTLFAITASAATAVRHGPTLVQPVDGAFVDGTVTVRIGFSGRSPFGPAEGTGMGVDGSASRLMPPERDGDIDAPPTGLSPAPGPAEGTGLARIPVPRGPHFALVIDQPPPLPGSPFHADEQHILFPVGIPQMNLALTPGNHSLLLVLLDGEGAAARRFRPSEPIAITVR